MKDLPPGWDSKCQPGSNPTTPRSDTKTEAIQHSQNEDGRQPQSLAYPTVAPEAVPLDIPKGYLAVYVGEIQKTRFVVPLSFLEHPLFQDLLRQSEEEFGFEHPMGGLTIRCQEDVFNALISRLSVS